MKNMLKNKKGFTLVELLAVIVILALLIVITANTVLPMMSRSKKTGMVTYAERVLQNAASNFQADSITGTGSSKGYSIEKIMGNDSYYGCVYVDSTNATGDNPTYKYVVTMYSSSDDLIFKGQTTEALFAGNLDDLVKDENSKPDSTTFTAAACDVVPATTTGNPYKQA